MMAQISDKLSTDRKFPRWGKFAQTFPSGESLCKLSRWGKFEQWGKFQLLKLSPLTLKPSPWEIFSSNFPNAPRLVSPNKSALRLVSPNKSALWKLGISATGNVYHNGRLLEHRKTKLESVGSVWRIRAGRGHNMTTYDEPWMEKYEELKEFQ
jgi:hypothetical protein